MRRRPGWPPLILAIATFGGCLALVTPIIAAEAEAAKPSNSESIKPPKPEPTRASKTTLGATSTYETLGKLPLMHEGRIKPLDTVAREEIKGIYGRETIQLASEDGKTLTSWKPVAAFFDWSVRPKFWDDQPIIAVEFLPLKRLILAEEIKTGLEVVAGKAATPEADRKRIRDLIAQPEIEAGDLRSIVRNGKLDLADALTLEKLASKVGEETRWMTPTDLETSEVTVEGKKVSFMAWLDSIIKRRQQQARSMSAAAAIPEIEKKALEVAQKLSRYRSIRDKEAMSEVPLLVAPRPANQAMLLFSGKALAKGIETQGRDLSPLELESAINLNKYGEDIDIKDRAEPGTDPKFDAKYSQWLKERSAWVPLQIILDEPIDRMTLAGFPTTKVEAFRAAYKAMEDEELTNPGRATAKPAIDLIRAATELGDSTNESYYPSLAEMSREVHFNDLAPFFKAPIAYLGGLLALTFSLIATNFGRSVNLESGFGKLSQGLYLAGIASFAAGIGLEVYGFILRILITGWAPVTNMYETVIWVGLISAVIGFVIEAIYKKTWAALAGAGVALACTALAAQVPLLDPEIKMLPPVLRSNFWLSIHVLTIVSSYAAFALAMGLGMAATTLYLTATYKRSASLGELALPIVGGLPLFVLGVLGYFASYGRFGAGEIVQAHGFWPSVIIACVGGVASVSSIVALIGEITNRILFHEQLDLEESFPTSIEPARVAAKSSARAQAMQATAAQIKPISNFIYRSMQVGILLVTAGTFLGGWWADVSWGRFWGWDPKEVWALITLLVYLVPLHGRFAGWVNTFWMVMASVVCFLSVLMAWYGVNFVLGVGLHSYGFTEGGGQGVVGVATLFLLSYAFGAAWRRQVSQTVLQTPA